MPMKPAMEVLPGFTSLDPYAMPKLEPELQALFDEFTPRHEWWDLLENKTRYRVEEKVKAAWNNRLVQRAWQTVKWWKPTVTLKLSERQLSRLSCRG